MIAYRSSASGGAGGDGAEYTCTIVSNGVKTLAPSSCCNLFRSVSIQQPKDFNYPITIGRCVNNLSGMFANSNFNQDFFIPESVVNCFRLLDGCMDFEKNVYFVGNTYRDINVYAITVGNYKRKNIYFNEVFNNLFNNSQRTGMTVQGIDANCYYNELNNVYFYHNYPG